jgi:hypothetical protein
MLFGKHAGHHAVMRANIGGELEVSFDPCETGREFLCGVAVQEIVARQARRSPRLVRAHSRAVEKVWASHRVELSLLCIFGFY